jgi:membrane protease YdiL (CAAX protease family)
MIWLGGMSLNGFTHPHAEKVVTTQAIITNVILFGVIVGGIVFFLTSRNISVVRLFGFTRVSLGRVLGIALGLLLAAFPLTALCTDIMVRLLGDEAKTQEILDFFVDSAKHSQWLTVVGTALAASVAAPILEEFVFRGYIYSVLRRYLGIGPGMLLSALLFGAIHGNVMAFPALCVLAMCLTLAYETTGSLAVPMTMHAVFNLVNLAINLAVTLWQNAYTT